MRHSRKRKGRHAKKSSKAYIGLIIIAPMLILGVFVFNHFRIYRDSLDNLLNNSAPDGSINIKNPFDTIQGLDNGLGSQGSGSEDNGTEGAGSEDTNPILDWNTQTQTGDSSYNRILGKHKVKFENFEKQQESKVQDLLKEAKADYDKNNSSLFSLANKYLGKINEMEKETDKEFDALTKSLETELRNSSQDTSIVKDLEDYYGQYKQNLKSELYRKATQSM